MTQNDIDKLVKLRELMTMQTFGSMDKAKDELVREHTRIWRNTWITPVLDDLIDKYTQQIQKTKLNRLMKKVVS